jgi:hypothetical protein
LEPIKDVATRNQAVMAEQLGESRNDASDTNSKVRAINTAAQQPSGKT